MCAASMSFRGFVGSRAVLVVWLSVAVARDGLPPPLAANSLLWVRWRPAWNQKQRLRMDPQKGKQAQIVCVHELTEPTILPEPVRSSATSSSIGDGQTPRIPSQTTQ